MGICSTTQLSIQTNTEWDIIRAMKHQVTPLFSLRPSVNVSLLVCYFTSLQQDSENVSVLKIFSVCILSYYYYLIMNSMENYWAMSQHFVQSPGINGEMVENFLFPNDFHFLNLPVKLNPLDIQLTLDSCEKLDCCLCQKSVDVQLPYRKWNRVSE